MIPDLNFSVCDLFLDDLFKTINKLLKLLYGDGPEGAEECVTGHEDQRRYDVIFYSDKAFCFLSLRTFAFSTSIDSKW